uniref:Uncharacterized protein n=1 Tax=Sarcophilus harrisii TaxID=9305 RepID=A0A7N4PNR5_SARHA
YDRGLLFHLKFNCFISVHSDLLPSAFFPVHVELLQGFVEVHQGRFLRGCDGIPCQSVVQSHYNVNTDMIRTLKIE